MEEQPILGKKKRQAIKQKIIISIDRKDLNKIKILLPQINFKQNSNVLLHLMIYSLSRKKAEIFDYFTKTMDINYENNDIGYTLFKKLFASGKISEYNVKFVLPLIVNINYIDKEKGRTLLYDTYFSYIYSYRAKASTKVYNDIIIMLLEHGADPFLEVNQIGGSLIHLILQQENAVESMEFILKNNKTGKFLPIKILAYVVSQYSADDKFDLVEMLLSYIADINEPYFLNHTVLWYVKAMDIDPDILELLEMSGAR